jgi:hypothetical protein
VSFLAPLFLLAAAALAVPLLLHLFRRRDERTQLFPALRYLRATTRERARTVRLRQLLLLALRLAVIVLLVLAGARLVLPLGGGDHPAAGVAMVIDNGIGSAMVTGDRRVLDLLVDQAVDAVDRLGPRDRVWVVAAGEPWRPALPLDREEARRHLLRLEPSQVRADLPAAVSRARSLLEAGAPPLREILVLSDLHRDAFPSGAGEEPTGTVRTVVGRPDPTPAPNRGVGELSVGGGLPPRAGLGSQLSVLVTGDSAHDQALRVYVDEALVTTGRTGDDGRVMLDLPPSPEGWLLGRVELDPDALRADDVRFFALPVRPRPLVHTAPDLSPHLATALAVLADRDRILPAAGGTAGVANESVGVSVEAGTPGPAGTRGVLLFAPTDPTRLPAVNRRLEELGTGWRLEATTPPSGIRTLDGGSELLRLPDGLEVARSYPPVPLEDLPPHDVLARLTDGTPWAIHVPRAEGDGDGPAVLLVATPMDPESSRLPTSAAMVPFLTAAIELLDGGSPTLEVEAGRPLPLPSDAAHLLTPDGTRLPVDGTSSFLETGRAGIYHIEDREGTVLARIAVNPPPPLRGPGDASIHLSPEEAARRLGGNAVGTTGLREWRRASLADRRGREVAGPLVALVFLLLVVEGWLAARGSSPRSGTRLSGGPRQ